MSFEHVRIDASADTGTAPAVVRPVYVGRRLDRAVIAFLLVVGLLVLGCAGSSSRPASDEERQRYAAILRTIEKDPSAGAAQLEAFVKRYPDSGLADDAAARLVGLALAEGDEARARDWLYLILRDYPDDPTADRARLQLAGMEAREGDDLAARRLLSRIDFERLSPAQQRSGYRLLADLSSDAVEAIVWRSHERRAALREISGRTPGPDDAGALEGGIEDLDRQIAAALELLSNEELEQLVRRLDDQPPTARTLLLLARRDLQIGDFDSAASHFKRAQRYEVSEFDRGLREEVSVALALRKRIIDRGDTLPSFEELAKLPIPSTDGATGTLGVVLPLTGRFAGYGEESLRGVMLAAQIFDPIPSIELPPGSEAPSRFNETDETDEAGEDGGRIDAASVPRLKILIRDSGGTPAGASLAVRELALEEDLVAIVGPLLADAAEAAGSVADELGVPLLALTSREDVPRDRPYVFRFRTTPGDEIRTLVNHAFEARKARRFAVLYPKDNYGRGMRDQYWEAVEEAGGIVVASAGYEPDATDFADSIRRMIGYSLLTGNEKEALERREALLRRGRRLAPEDAAVARRVAYSILGPSGEALPPTVDFDALFIPDSHDRVVLIAPQLTFHEVDDVRLLGPGDWLHDDLTTIGGKHVRGAVISTLFHPDSRFPFVSEFVEGFTHTFGKEPDVFSAHSYDATRLVLVQLIAGRETRDDVRSGIMRTQAFPGASGVISVLPDGNARKRPFLLEVRGKRIISLD